MMIRFQLLQTLILNLLVFAATAKADCVDRACGNVHIPYPFGTTPGCYQSEDFRVTCNRTSYNPPKLFFQDSTIEIKNISLFGQMTVMQYVSYHCYDAGNNTNPVNSSTPRIWFSKFKVNNTANKFTVVGCDSYGYIYGRRETYRFYRTGCIPYCYNETDLEDGSCSGSGCCQTSIPDNVWRVNVKVGSYDNYTTVSSIGNCTYGFLVEDGAFKFSREMLTNLKDVKSLPMVVDWTIGNENTCGEAQNNHSYYACKSTNSHCQTSKELRNGYRCYCNDGYSGNPYLTNGCQDIDECNDPVLEKTCKYNCVNTEGSFNCTCPKGYKGDGRKDGEGCNGGESRTLRIVAGVFLGAILLLLVSGLAYMVHNKRQSKRAKQKWFIQNGGEKLQQELHRRREGSRDVLTIFSSYDLKKATNDFHKSNIVGQGGFGTVYRGELLDKRTVAIKKSKLVDPNQTDQFVNEVIVLSQINHRNTVKLLGCCLETEVPLLVYEFISNGTLSKHLHGPTWGRLLDWDKRLRIAAEAAGVLSYLHSAASYPIIHRDVKSDNILLDHNYTAKVADFGASRLIALDQTQISTVVQGTTGYLDPEYLLTQQLTAKSDVYSFGVVLLELITRRRAITNTGPEKERNLVSYCLSMMEQDRFDSLIDGNIVDEGNREEVMEVGRLAEWCVKMKGEERPDMKVVAVALESLRLGRKQPFIQIHQQKGVENMQSFVAEGFDGIIGNDSGIGASGSTVFQMPRPVSRGR